MSEPNISLLGATYSGVKGVTLPKQGGGTATFPWVEGSETKTANGTYDVTNLAEVIVNVSGGGGGSYPQFGPNTEYVGRLLNKTINLSSNTTFDSWTASTTAGTIKAASSANDFTFSCDWNYDYWIFTLSQCAVAFKAGATLNATTIKSVTAFLQSLFAYPSTTANFNNGTSYSSNNNASTAGTRAGLRYYNSSGNVAFTASTYGPAYIGSAPTISVSSGTAGYKLPAVNARCQSSYFATARKAEVDSANTNLIITVDVYRTPKTDHSCGWMIEQLRLATIS